MATKIDDLTSEIMNQLNLYSDEVAEKVKEVVDEVSKDVMQEIKNHCQFEERTGKYVKSFKIKTVKESKRNKTNVWYAANGQHRLTHLLEKGHATRSGGRTKAFPHIKYGQDYIDDNFEEKIKEAINDIR